MLNKLWAWVCQIATQYPVQLSGAFAMLVQFASSQVIPMSVAQQGGLNALAVAVLGFVAAAGVSEQRAVPAIVGVIQAILACVLAFNVAGMTPTLESAIMAFVTAGSAFFVHTQVVAKGSAKPAGKHEANFSRMRG